MRKLLSFLTLHYLDNVGKIKMYTQRAPENTRMEVARSSTSGFNSDISSCASLRGTQETSGVEGRWAAAGFTSVSAAGGSRARGLCELPCD